MRQEIDVLVAGEGPAGATIARILARTGRSVLVVDPGQKQSKRLEVIPPKALSAIDDLDLHFLLKDLRIAVPCLGIRQNWNGHTRIVDDFLVHRGGQGFVVDREAFDSALCVLASAAGATTIMARVSAVRGTQQGWIVTVSGKFGTSTIGADVVVDATGRSAAVARRMGAIRMTQIKQVAARLHTGVNAINEARSVWLDVEKRSGEDTWVYEVAGPRGSRQRWLVGPSDRFFTCANLKVDASSRLLSPTAGLGWIAIGDASISFDPISSQGLFHALSSARIAAGAIIAGAIENARSIEAYSEAVSQTFCAYAAARSKVFQQ